MRNSSKLFYGTPSPHHDQPLRPPLPILVHPPRIRDLKADIGMCDVRGTAEWAAMMPPGGGEGA